MANRVGLFYITKKRVPLYRNYFKLYSHNKLKVPGISQGNEMCNMSESMVFGVGPELARLFLASNGSTMVLNTQMITKKFDTVLNHS